MSKDPKLLDGSAIRLYTMFKSLGVTSEVIDSHRNLIKYQTVNGDWRTLWQMVSEKLPVLSKRTCDNKWWTARLLSDLAIPYPDTQVLSSVEQLNEFIAKHTRVVVKPRDGAHGHGVSMNVSVNVDPLLSISFAKQYADRILIQEQIEGRDIRILVVGDQIVSALERKPASVIGDGSSTIIELIEKENARPERGKQGIDTLVEISLSAVKQFLSDEQLRVVPEDGQEVRVVGPSNQSKGGTVCDVTEEMSPLIRKDALRITKELNMPIAGVDCIINATGHYFIEINASPGIGIHDDPALGIKSNCFEAYAKLLYQDTWWR